MIHTVAASVVLLAGTVLGRRENVELHEATTGWEIPGEEFEDTINAIYYTFQQRAIATSKQSGQPYTPAQSIFALTSGVTRNSENTQGCGKNINSDGWQVMYSRASAFEKKTSDQNFEKGFNELFDFLSGGTGCVNPHEVANQLSVSAMSAARVAVLKDVFEKITGNVATPMQVGDMTCKEAEKQEFFFACMHGDCDAQPPNTSPVDFNTFKLYYNWLGMFIASDDQFILMVVNAWHMMGKYASINTVNLRMRCYEDEDLQQAGVLVTLDPDCPSPRTSPADALRMAREQHCPGEMTCFKYGCKF